MTDQKQIDAFFIIDCRLWGTNGKGQENVGVGELRVQPVKYFNMICDC